MPRVPPGVAARVLLDDPGENGAVSIRLKESIELDSFEDSHHPLVRHVLPFSDCDS